MTIICHAFGFLPFVLRSSWAGVDLFFVISGFVITTSLLEALPDLPASMPFAERVGACRGVLRIFFLKRFYRIVPLAAAVLVLTAVLLGVLGEDLGSFVAYGREVLGVLSGFYNYVAAMDILVPKRLTYFWSLAVEEHFYLVLPFLLILARTTSSRILVAVAGIVLVALVFRPLSYRLPMDDELAAYTRFATHNRFDTLMAGVLIALVRREKWGQSFSRRTVWGTLAVGVVMGLLWVLPGAFGTGNQFIHPLFISLLAFSSVLVFAASLDQGYIVPLPLFGRVLEYLGSRSYALYISSGMPTLVYDRVQNSLAAYKQALPWLEGKMVTAAVLVGFVGAVLLVAEALHRFVEKPCMELGRRRIRQVEAESPHTARGAAPGGADEPRRSA